MPSDTALFLSRLLKNPRQVSALAPSSPFLARAMTAGLGPHTGRVVEFGPGTGSLTRAILWRGVPPADLTLFELDPRFADRLRRAMPGVAVLNEPADAAAAFVAPGVGAVISGLPLLSMPTPICTAIVAAAFCILAPGAPLVQFTYGSRQPIPSAVVDDLALTVVAGPAVWLNLPPARIYLYRRAD